MFWKTVELEKRLEALEQTLKMVAGVVDDTLVAAEKARIAAQGASVTAKQSQETHEEFLKVLKRAIEETPGLPFERTQAVLGRVSAVRAHLKLLEERSSQ